MDVQLKLRTFLKNELERIGSSKEFQDGDSLFISGRLDSIAAVRLLLFLEAEADFGSDPVVQDLSQIDSFDKILKLIAVKLWS